MSFFLTAFLSFFLLFASHSGAITLLETAMVQDVQPSGFALGVTPNSTQIAGVRFEITEKTKITRVGAQLFNGSATAYTALISLDGAEDFPDTFDLTGSDVLGTGLINVLSTGNDVSASFDLTVSAGWYAAVFGGGLVGADSRGGSISESNDVIGEPSFFVGYAGPDQWREKSTVSPWRIIVEGEAIPEQGTGIFLCLSLLCLLFKRCKTDAYKKN